jgi:hypothetical protein
VVGTINKDIFKYSSPCSLVVLICPSSRGCRSFGSVSDRILELRDCTLANIFSCVLIVGWK